MFLKEQMFYKERITGEGEDEWVFPGCSSFALVFNSDLVIIV